MSGERWCRGEMVWEAVETYLELGEVLVVVASWSVESRG